MDAFPRGDCQCSNGDSGTTKEISAPLSPCTLLVNKNATRTARCLVCARVFSFLADDTPLKGELPRGSGLDTFLACQREVVLTLGLDLAPSGSSSSKSNHRKDCQWQRQGESTWFEPLAEARLGLDQFRNDHVQKVELQAPLLLSTGRDGGGGGSDRSHLLLIKVCAQCVCGSILGRNVSIPLYGAVFLQARGIPPDSIQSFSAEKCRATSMSTLLPNFVTDAWYCLATPIRHISINPSVIPRTKNDGLATPVVNLKGWDISLAGRQILPSKTHPSLDAHTRPAL